MSGLPFRHDEIVLCAYAARFNGDDFPGIDAIHSLLGRSRASIQMKIQNIAAMLEEQGIVRSNEVSPLSGRTTGEQGRRTNWDIVSGLLRLSREEHLAECHRILQSVPNNEDAGQLESDGGECSPEQVARRLNVEDLDLTDEAIDEALRANRLRIGIVATGSEEAYARRRKGQERLRKLTLDNYGGCCAVCDVTDPALLVTSHVVRWADAPEHRGNLANVICLCRIHDALFEAGYWSLGDGLELLKKEPVTSETIRHLLQRMTSFSRPLNFCPSACFVRRHRERFGLGT
jgi:hypothetical protein